MDVKKTIMIKGRPVAVSLSPAARVALESRATPLYVEMELYFSCLIRLKVRFHEAEEHGQSVPVSDRLRVSFRPVMTASCDTDYEGSEPPLTDFPIAREEAFVPKWLTIDHVHGQWQGEFGMCVKSDG